MNAEHERKGQVCMYAVVSQICKCFVEGFFTRYDMFDLS